MGYRETTYGFEYGAAHIERLYTGQDGAVTLRIKTPREDAQVRITKTGLIRFIPMNRQK